MNEAQCKAFDSLMDGKRYGHRDDPKAQYFFLAGWDAAIQSIPRISEQELENILAAHMFPSSPVMNGPFDALPLDRKRRVGDLARSILARFPQLVTRTEE